MRRLPEFALQIFLVSLGALLLEVSYTRIFSFKLFYYFAFMVIAFALLGTGSGGVLLAVSKRARALSERSALRWGSLVAALSTLGGFVVVAKLPTAVLSMAQDLRQLAALAALCLALFPVFLAIGFVLALLFSRSSRDAGLLYGIDLVGAAAGCALAIPAMKLLTPPGAVMAAGAAFALSALVSARGSRGFAVLAAALTAGALLLAVFPQQLPAIEPDAIKYLRGTPQTLWTRWSPIFRIDVTEAPAGLPGENLGERRIIAHDGLLGSTLQKFDGDFTKLQRFDHDARRLPFTVVPPAPRVLIIGSAGGHELLASLYYGASAITGVELNASTVELLRGPFADYTGRIAYDPRIRIVNAEGRSFLARREVEPDIVFFVAPDSYASMNAAASGAFVLSESYLYTSEAIGEALDALSPDGVVCMQFGEFYFDAKPNRTLRYLASARAALEARGVADPGAHLLVAVTHGGASHSTILVSRRPFTAEQRQAFAAQVASSPSTRVEWSSDGPSDDRLRQVVTARGTDLERFYASYPYDVSPVRDDAPFFWHFARFSDLLAGRETGLRQLPDIEDSVGERVLLRMTLVALLFAAACLLLPFVALRREFAALRAKADTFAFFAAIGVGFLFLEVSLIQRLTLLLGYPTYSLAVTLMTLLFTSGIGSMLGRPSVSRDRTALVLVAGIAACVCFYAMLLPALIPRLAQSGEVARVAAAIVFISPLGLLLGRFLPLGLAAVADLAPEGDTVYPAWAWAVNGFFSVLSSVLSTIFAMSFGFTVVSWMAVGCYLVAVLALRRLDAAATAPAR